MLRLQKNTHCAGEVELPGSNGISNRALLLAALRKGPTLITNLVKSYDTECMITALTELGVVITPDDISPSKLLIIGYDGRFPEQGSFDNPVRINVGSSITTYMFLTAALALMGGYYTIYGDGDLYIYDLLVPLWTLGADMNQPSHLGAPLLQISPFAGSGEFTFAVTGESSGQVASALLMASTALKRDIDVNIKQAYISNPDIHLTSELMRNFGYDVHFGASRSSGFPAFCLQRHPDDLNGDSLIEIEVEGDATIASYFWLAGVISHGPITTYGVGSISTQSDLKLLKELEKIGGCVEVDYTDITTSRPVDNKIAAFSIDGSEFPDAAMGLAILALIADGVSTITNIGSWTEDERARIDALTSGLRKLGATVHSGLDWISIKPPYEIVDNATIETFNDHRIAMCFSLVSLMGVSINIEKPTCVNKTFPEYFDVFSKLIERYRQSQLELGESVRRFNEAHGIFRHPISDVNSAQVGGSHYKQLSIQPWDFIISNDLGYLEGNVVKYVSRYKNKNGVDDLKKARHYLDKLIELKSAEQ